MTEQSKKILDMFQTGLKAEEISTILNIEYNLVSRIIKNYQFRIRRLKDPQKYRDRAKRNYPKYANKIRISSAKRYAEKHDEIRNKIKEFRKTSEGKIYFREKRQKEKAKDPEGFKRKKNENWAKNYPKNKDRLSKKTKLDRITNKKTVFKHYSKGKLVCNCCKLDGNYGRIVGLDFLTVDHIMPKKEMEKNEEMKKIGYSSTRKGSSLYQWLITTNFPNGFQILCWNCNKAKGILGKCPHQK